MLARREHGRRELARKLAARGCDQADIEAALERLAAAGLQDDQRYANAYVRQRAERGFGPRRIVQELETRGIEAALARAAVAAAEQDFTALARSVSRRKFRHAPASLAERARQTRFLEYRGFDAAQIRYALGRTTDHEDL